MKTIKFIKIKDCVIRKALTCDKEDLAITVARKLRDSKERHVIVLDFKKPTGIISTTDISNRIVAENKDPAKTKAKDMMTRNLMIRDIHDSLARAYIDMIKSSIYSCLVVDNGKIKGMLDLREAMNHLVKTKIKK